MKKVIAVTGIRSEYDILYPVIKALDAHPEFQLKLVVSGAHLSNEHGLTLERIRGDGFEIADCIDSLLMTDRLTQRPKAVASLITGLSQTVERERPDFLLVVGDREESIATTIVGNYMNVLVAHIGGGDPVFGNADDPIRFACSKLAHIHFTTAQPYSDNLLKLGEDPWRVWFCGTPGLDNIRAVPLMSLEQVSAQLGRQLDRYIVFLKHPLSSEREMAAQQMTAALDALDSFSREHQVEIVGIQPNSDPGSHAIWETAKAAQYERIRFHQTLPRNLFINLMRHALALAGNSSMGILEAPMYRLPVVNIGNRQQGRFNAGNVEFVGYGKEEITAALEKAVFDQSYRTWLHALDNPYGDGHAARRIVDALETIDPSDERWHTKRKLI